MPTSQARECSLTRPRGRRRDRRSRLGRRAVLAGAGAAIAGLAGCLSNPWSPGGAEQPAEEESSDGEAGNGETDGDIGAGTGQGADERPEPDQVVEVAAEAFRFTPGSFEIAVGDTVRWVWRDSGHNVRPDNIPDAAEWGGTAGGDSETYAEGHELQHTVEVPGEYSYYCAPHRSLGLRGSFTVVE